MIQGSDKVIPKSYLKPFPPCIICKTISASAGMEGHPCSARMAVLDLPRHPYISAKDFCKSCRLTCTQARATQCINLSSWLSHGTLSENLCRYVSIYYIYIYIDILYEEWWQVTRLHGSFEYFQRHSTQTARYLPILIPYTRRNLKSQSTTCASEMMPKTKTQKYAQHIAPQSQVASNSEYNPMWHGYAVESSPSLF